MNTRAVVCVIAFALAACAFGQESDYVPYEADADGVVPEETQATPVYDTYDDESGVSPSYDDDDEDSAYHTQEITQRHSIQAPEYTSRWEPEETVHYEPEEVTRDRPVEVYYTKPVHVTTTDAWYNASEEEWVPYWKHVTMTVNVTLPINTVTYKRVVKLEEGDESELKKVMVPRRTLRVREGPKPAGSAALTMVQQYPDDYATQSYPVQAEPVQASYTDTAPVYDDGTTQTVQASPQSVYAKDELPYQTGEVTQTRTVERPVYTTHYAPQTEVRYQPQEITNEIPTRVYYTKPIHEKTSETWSNRTERVLVPYWKKVTMTVNVTIPINTVEYQAVTKLIQGNETELKKVFVPRSEITDNANATKAPAMELGVTKETAAFGEDDEPADDRSLTTERTLKGPLEYEKTVDMPQRQEVQRPVEYRTYVPETEVHYEAEKVQEHIKVPLPSWQQDSKVYRNVTSWKPVQKTVHIVKPVTITFMTQELKWTNETEQIETKTVEKGEDETKGRADNYLKFTDGVDEATEPPTVEELQETPYATTTTSRTLPGPLAYAKTQEVPQRVTVQRPVVERTYVPEAEVRYHRETVTEHVKAPLPSWSKDSKVYHNVTTWEPVEHSVHIVKHVAVSFSTQELKKKMVVEPIENVTVTRGDDEDDDAGRYIDYSSGDDGVYDPNEPAVEELIQESAF